MLLLLLKLELLKIPPNYVTLDSRITRLSSLQPNHQQEEHYIANHLSYKPCNELNIYKKSELESTLVEIINPKKVKYYCWCDLQASFYGCYRF